MSRVEVALSDELVEAPAPAVALLPSVPPPPDGPPWPRVHVGGKLENALGEWVHANGAGAFAMSTVALMHTRRQHGMLVAALDAPINRHVVLSHMETSLETSKRSYALSTHQFPNIAPTPGYRHLGDFAQDPLPRWTLTTGEGELERTLALVRGKNALVLRFRWEGKRRSRLVLKPLMPFRPTHELMREHGAMVQRVTMRNGAVEIQPMSHVPPVYFEHDGVFVGSPDWWRRFEYSEDRDAGREYAEDLWTPGSFELILEPGVSRYLLVSVGERLEPCDSLTSFAGGLLAETRRHLLAQDPGPSMRAELRTLHIAADAYVVTAAPRPSVLAGYPWLDSRTRDLLVALPGLLLTRGRVDQARDVLAQLVKLQRGGLLPLRLPRSDRNDRSPFLPDATLWLFEAVRAFAEQVPATDPVLRHRLYPALVRAFVAIRRGHRAGVWLTEDGLVATRSPDGAPLSWMDARIGVRPVTPRVGCAVEHQALWARGCDTLADLAERYGALVIAAGARGAASRLREAFRARFWCAQTDYPFDCVPADAAAPGAWPDASVRPNAVIALDVDPSCFESWQARAIVQKANLELLTPRGLRSLSPRDPKYRGFYEGRPDEREAAYHQGTAWAHLLGAYARAAQRAFPDDASLAEDVRERCLACVRGGPVLGHIAQLSDGELPHRPKGTPAEAWAVAELLRVLSER